MEKIGALLRQTRPGLIHALPHPPVSEASREVVNLTERKNLHTPVYGVKEFVCLSVCLCKTLTPFISGLAKQNGLRPVWQKQAVLRPQFWTNAPIFMRKSMGS